MFVQIDEKIRVDKKRKIVYTCKVLDFYSKPDEATPMAKDLRMVLLMDCYGDFLTEHQRKLLSLYYEEDLSLSEIAALPEMHITRQGVRDGIKRGEHILREMERKLGFAQRLTELESTLSSLTETLDALLRLPAGDENIRAGLEEARAQANKSLALVSRED